MAIVAAVLRVLPGAWLERALAGQPRKRRHEPG